MAIQFGSTVSDLHLFAHRSEAERHLETIFQAADRSQLFILNGDIFDLSWSRHREALATLESARSWLTKLAERFDHCRFVVIGGNHDCGRAYFEMLDLLSRTHSNVLWRPDFYQLGEKVFLHGDVVDRKTTFQRLQQRRYRANQIVSRHRAWGALYSGITYTGAHNVATWLISPKLSARRLNHYLEDALGPRYESVGDVYFGHTHCSMQDFVFHGRRFHNSGTAVRRQRFQILHFEYDSAEMPAFC